VLDLFCGIGNFTLPIAKKSREVVGIEGSHELFVRANANAVINHLDHKVSWQHANLFEVSSSTIRSWGAVDKWLVDPPRDGAFELMNALAELVMSQNQNDLGYIPKKIVYISCNPATLARDAEVLVHRAGYQLKQAGILNMFPHTSHVESIAVFEKQ
jgi:23S rRNA (uracil1939-C5)-methyltransferase